MLHPIHQVNGERVHGIADASRLWTRLEETIPRVPENPESGFAADAIKYSKYGRGYVQIALGQTTTKAWQYWGEIRRAHIHGGGEEADRFGEYYVEVREYRERHRGVSG